MCRFLVMSSSEAIDGATVLDEFRRRCRDSVEYQGHGWGATWRVDGNWTRYRSLTPIWDDTLELPEKVDFLIVHARSAFRDAGIAIENNMPFYQDEKVFVFNGELRGVRLRIPGRIGAEKIFRLIQRHDDGDLSQALASADRVLLSRSEYVRALNAALTDGERIYASCRFNETPEYFTLHYRNDTVRAVCSEPLDPHFRPMRNGQQISL